MARKVIRPLRSEADYENALDETAGTCGTGSWDWNGNTSIEMGVVFDVNSSDTGQVASCGGTLTTLRDHDDWGAVRYTGIQDGDGAPIEVSDCSNPAPETDL